MRPGWPPRGWLQSAGSRGAGSEPNRAHRWHFATPNLTASPTADRVPNKRHDKLKCPESLAARAAGFKQPGLGGGLSQKHGRAHLTTQSSGSSSREAPLQDEAARLREASAGAGGVPSPQRLQVWGSSKYGRQMRTGNVGEVGQPRQASLRAPKGWFWRVLRSGLFSPAWVGRGSLPEHHIQGNILVAISFAVASGRACCMS